MIAIAVLYMSLAVGLSIVGAILSAIGYVMQKKGHIEVIEVNEIHEIQDEDTNSFWSNKTWVGGFIIYVIGSLLTAAALKFGAQSVLAPLGALVLVCNAVFATKFLGEPFKRNNLYGIILVVIGSIMAVLYGPRSSTDPITIKYIEGCWQTHHFLLFFSVLTIIIIIDFIFIKIFERKNFHAMENHNITHGANFLMISYISLAAYFGSTNVLFMKSAVIIIGSFELSYLVDYFFYITIVGIILVNVLLENFRQKALVYFDARYVVPIYQVLLILGSALMGAIFFNEFALLSVIELAVFSIAIVITLLGVAILAYDVGAVYKKMMRILDEKTPKSLHFSKEKPLSVRSIAQKSFYQRSKQHGQHKLVFPAFNGAGNYVAAQFYSKSPRFMFNDSLNDTLQIIDIVASPDVEQVVDRKKTFEFPEDSDDNIENDNIENDNTKKDDDNIDNSAKNKEISNGHGNEDVKNNNETSLENKETSESVKNDKVEHYVE